MSANKRHSQASEIYADHLGRKFNTNPVTGRVGLMERMYRRILGELAMNRFDWHGLPNEVDIRFLEMNLYYSALSVFFKDKDTDKYMALTGGGIGQLNPMDNPKSFFVTGNGNFRSRMLSARDCVPIWANYMRIPDMDIVTIYAHRLAELDRTIEINSSNARRNKFVIGTDGQRLTNRNIDREIDAGSNHIEVSGALQDMQFVQALDLSVNPESYEKMHILRTRQWNECLGLLGINGANQDKKERLVAAEVGANDDQIDSMKWVNLNARRTAAKAISEMTGNNVTVNFRSDVEARSEAVFDSLINDNGSAE